MPNQSDLYSHISALLLDADRILNGREGYVDSGGILKAPDGASDPYPDRGYEIRSELWALSEYEDPTPMRSAYSIPEGYYIGQPEDAETLWSKYGITKWECSPDDTRTPDARVVIAGYSPRDNKWYGWSHRAITGFGVGDKVFDEDFGDDSTKPTEHGDVEIRSIDDAFDSAVSFAKSVASYGS